MTLYSEHGISSNQLERWKTRTLFHGHPPKLTSVQPPPIIQQVFIGESVKSIAVSSFIDHSCTRRVDKFCIFTVLVAIYARLQSLPTPRKNAVGLSPIATSQRSCAADHPAKQRADEAYPTGRMQASLVREEYGAQPYETQRR